MHTHTAVAAQLQCCVAVTLVGDRSLAAAATATYPSHHHYRTGCSNNMILTGHQHKPAAVDDNSALWRQLQVYCFYAALLDDHTVAKRRDLPRACVQQAAVCEHQRRLLTSLSSALLCILQHTVMQQCSTCKASLRTTQGAVLVAGGNVGVVNRLVMQSGGIQLVQEGRG
jgi:hypothetical protein